MSQYRHIIWDWNGTLFDDAWLCVEIINQLLIKRRLPLVDAERYQQEFIFPVKEYYRNLGFDFSVESFEILSVEYLETYDRRRFECGLQPDANGILHELALRGYRQSMLSASEQSRLEEMVAFTGLEGFFSHIIGLNDYYAASKVDQGKRLIAELECSPASIVLIGDSLHDAEVAEAMGIDCILIPSGHCSRERLLSYGVEVVDSLAELVNPLGISVLLSSIP